MWQTTNMMQLIGVVGKNPIVSYTGIDNSNVYFSLGETPDAAAFQKSDRLTRWYDCIVTGHYNTVILTDIKTGDRLLVQGSIIYDKKQIEGRPSKLAKISIQNFELLGRNSVDKDIIYKETDPTGFQSRAGDAH